MKVLLAGGSGSLGRPLARALASAGHEPVLLTRRARDLPFRQVVWDGTTVGAWAEELEGAGALVNLAGELVDRRPTRANVALLTRSRVEPTRALAEAAGQLPQPLPVWVQASTLAVYGDSGDEVLDETSPLADEPPQMVDVATAWEQAATGVNAQRQVVLRTSIVLDADAPALRRLTGLVRWGLGGTVGSGRQWFSWIHLDDWVAITCEALGVAAESDHRPLEGVVLATSPSPVRNEELMRSLRRVLGRRVGLPSPAPLVRLGALALSTDPALGLTGRRARSTRLAERGFAFEHPELDGALRDLLAPGANR